MRLRSHALIGEEPNASVSSRRPVGEIATDAGAVAALVAATIGLYHAATPLWWHGDHFFHLRFLQRWSPLQYFLDRAVWDEFPARMWTPMLFLSLEVDHALFGFAPRGWYWHQLLALAGAAAALYLLLRLWLKARWALVGGMLFLAGAPVASLTPLLARHYVEGLTLALLAVVAWVTAARAPTVAAWSLVILSVVLWLAAAASKEVFVPLALVLPLIPAGTTLQRLQRWIPYALALAFYLGARRYMLGVLVGGYGWAMQPEDRPHLLLSLPLRVGREILGAPALVAWIACAGLLAGCVLLAGTSRRGALLLAVGLLLAVLPVLPVAQAMTARYALVAWVVLVIAFVFGARTWPRWGAALAVGTTLAFFAVNRSTIWPAQLAVPRRAGAEDQALLRLGAGQLVRLPVDTPAGLRELASFGAEVGRPMHAGWFGDDLYLCSPAHVVERLWQWDESRPGLVDVSPKLAELRRLRCSTLHPEVPLSGDFVWQGGTLGWRLGPQTEGRWWFVFEEGHEAHEVPAHGGFQLGDVGELTFRLRYDAPAGWSTYSPPLHLDSRRQKRYVWRRPAASVPTTPPRGSS